MNNLVNIDNLSLTEKKVINYIINNVDSLEQMSIKQISSSLKVSESLITKSCKNLSFSGFKELKQFLLKQYYFKKEKNLKNDFYINLFNSLKLSNNILNYDLVEQITDKLCEHNKKIIIFATGKTNIIAKYFYFTLLEYGLNCILLSSLYEESGFNTKDAIIFVLSISGNNSKINRYLNIVSSIKNYNFIVGITASCNFISKEYVNYHIYGDVKKYFSSDQKANPFIEKYIVMYLIDNILLSFFEKFKNNNAIFLKNVKSKNFI